MDFSFDKYVVPILTSFVEFCFDVWLLGIKMSIPACFYLLGISNIFSIISLEIISFLMMSFLSCSQQHDDEVCFLEGAAWLILFSHPFLQVRIFIWSFLLFVICYLVLLVDVLCEFAWVCVYVSFLFIVSLRLFIPCVFISISNFLRLEFSLQQLLLGCIAVFMEK